MNYACYQGFCEYVLFQKRTDLLHETVCVLYRNRNAIPNLETNANYARAYNRLWEKIRNYIRWVQKLFLMEKLWKLHDTARHDMYMRSMQKILSDGEERICKMIYENANFERIKLDFFMQGEKIGRLLDEYRAEKAMEPLAERRMSNES